MAITKEMLTASSPLFIRTDFSSEAAWAQIRDEGTATVQIDGGELAGGYDAAPNVLVIDNREFDGLTTEQLLDLPWPDCETEGGPDYFFVVDGETVRRPEHPILALSLYMEKGESFRVIPKAMAMVEMNLSIANLSFSDYGQQGDGIERYSGIL